MHIDCGGLVHRGHWDSIYDLQNVTCWESRPRSFHLHADERVLHTDQYDSYE